MFHIHTNGGGGKDNRDHKLDERMSTFGRNGRNLDLLILQVAVEDLIN